MSIKIYVYLLHGKLGVCLNKAEVDHLPSVETMAVELTQQQTEWFNLLSATQVEDDEWWYNFVSQCFGVFWQPREEVLSVEIPFLTVVVYHKAAKLAEQHLVIKDAHKDRTKKGLRRLAAHIFHYDDGNIKRVCTILEDPLAGKMAREIASVFIQNGWEIGTERGWIKLKK